MPLPERLEAPSLASSSWETEAVREEASYVHVDGQPVFCVTHRPTGQPRGTAVIVGPLLAELVANYRREVDLARQLASSGYAVRRFHFRGAGRSGGELADMTFETMRGDTIGVTADLVASVDSGPPVMIGTRFGALVAAASQASRGLVLWEPVLDPARYFREIMQSLQLHALKEGKTAPSESLGEMLERSDFADVFGYPIHRNLFESLSAIDPARVLTQADGPMLVLRITSSAKLGSRTQELVTALRASGTNVDVELIPGQEAWWFSTTQGKQRQADPSAELVARTSDWIRSTMEGQS